jgi:hypothetical protein
MEASNGGNTFVVFIKYNAKSIVGDPTPPANPENYNWTTSVGGVVQATAGIALRLTGTQLAPSAGSGVWAANLTNGQLKRVVDAALDNWQAAGASAAQLNVLRNTPIHIIDWLDAPRLGVEGDGEIWLNANAAGWGWNTNPVAAPVAGQMDLLSVVDHEFGHVLYGVNNGTGLMAATLQPGTRILPTSASLGLDQGPTAAAPVHAFVPAASLAPTLSPRATDIAAAFSSLRPEVAVPATAIVSSERSGPAVVSPQASAYSFASQATAQVLALSGVSHASRNAAFDYLFSSGDALLLSEEEVPAPAEVGDVSAGQLETPLFDQEHEYLFNGDGTPGAGGRTDRLFGNEDVPSFEMATELGESGIGAAVALLGGSCLLASQFPGREEKPRRVREWM